MQSKRIVVAASFLQRLNYISVYLDTVEKYSCLASAECFRKPELSLGPGENTKISVAFNEVPIRAKMNFDCDDL